MFLQRVLLFVLGLVFGSFFSALSFRLPKNISIASGRSFCPRCKKPIVWYTNIPLLSFLLLGGKCGFCKKPISWRYPLIELTAGLGFLIIGPNILALVIFSILELIFIIDFEHQIIPDTLVFAGILVSIFNFKFLFFNYLLAGFLAAFLLLAIFLATKGRGMGLGDVKFAVFGGALVGLKLMPVWLFLAFLTGGITGIILVLARRARLKDHIAFGPFLIAAIPITLIWGEKILHLLWLS